MTNKFKQHRNSDAPVKYDLNMLHAHCETLNGYRWVKASGKRYVVVRGEDGKHFLDFRAVRNA